MTKDILVDIKQGSDIPFTIYKITIKKELYRDDEAIIMITSSFNSKEELESWVENYLLTVLNLSRKDIKNNIDYIYE